MDSLTKASGVAVSILVAATASVVLVLPAPPDEGVTGRGHDTGDHGGVSHRAAAGWPAPGGGRGGAPLPAPGGPVGVLPRIGGRPAAPGQPLPGAAGAVTVRWSPSRAGPAPSRAGPAGRTPAGQAPGQCCPAAAPRGGAAPAGGPPAYS